MKKYFTIAIIFISISLSAQKFSNQFDKKAYANEQTEMIKSALDLNQETADNVYKLNLSKAYSVQKYIILFESQDKVKGKTLSQIIKEVNKDAERSVRYQQTLKAILGNEKYQQYLEKFGSK